MLLEVGHLSLAYLCHPISFPLTLSVWLAQGRSMLLSPSRHQPGSSPCCNATSRYTPCLTPTLLLCFLFMLTPGCPLLQQLMPFTKCVVATGGGAVLRRKNWGFMQHAVVIWLDGSPELLASHVVGQTGGTMSRPLIFSSADVKQQEQVSMLCPVMSLCFLSVCGSSNEEGGQGGGGGGGRWCWGRGGAEGGRHLSVERLGVRQRMRDSKWRVSGGGAEGGKHLSE